MDSSTITLLYIQLVIILASLHIIFFSSNIINFLKHGYFPGQLYMLC